MKQYLKKIKQFIFSKFKEPCTPQPLGLFRIFFFTILLVEIYQIYCIEDLYFKGIGLGGWEHILIPLWAFCTTLIILGVPYFKIIAIINYLLVVRIMGHPHNPLEYHMDFAWIGVSFLTIFTPLDNSYSIRNWIKKRIPHSVPQIYYYILIFIPLGLIYFDSIFFKWSSHMWTSLLGLWMPSSIPPIAFNDLSLILNNKFISSLSSLITIVFETVFILVFWFTVPRYILFFVGVMLHIGICIAFPIPWFGLGYCALYILLLYKKDSTTQPLTITPYKISFLSALMVCLFIFQIHLVSVAPGTINPLNIRNFKVFARMRPIMLQFFGVTHHPVFMDPHFENYKFQFRAYIKYPDGKVTFLTNDDRGLVVPKFHVIGRQWVYWTFRVNTPYAPVEDVIRQKVLTYATYITKKWNYCPSDCEIVIEKRNFQFTINYKKYLLKELMALPWIPVATLKKDSTSNEFVVNN